MISTTDSRGRVRVFVVEVVKYDRDPVALGWWWIFLHVWLPTPHEAELLAWELRRHFVSRPDF